MTIINVTRSTTLATKAAIAKTPAARMQGLLGRDSLAAEEALVITQCRSIHMFFMKFPLDVIFINKQGKIVGLCPQIKPFHLSPIFFLAQDAIELPVGTIAQSQSKIGDFLQIS